MRLEYCRRCGRKLKATKTINRYDEETGEPNYSYHFRCKYVWLNAFISPFSTDHTDDYYSLDPRENAEISICKSAKA